MHKITRRNPLPAVDAIIERGNAIVLVKRRLPPFRGTWTLPGGFLDYGETVEHAAEREAKEETSLKIKLKELLGVYSSPKRDPREHTVSAVFVASVAGGKLKAGDDAIETKWFPLSAVPRRLAFDHSQIFRDYLKWKREKSTYWSTK